MKLGTLFSIVLNITAYHAYSHIRISNLLGKSTEIFFNIKLKNKEKNLVNLEMCKIINNRRNNQFYLYLWMYFEYLLIVVENFYFT